MQRNRNIVEVDVNISQFLVVHLYILGGLILHDFYSFSFMLRKEF